MKEIYINGNVYCGRGVYAEAFSVEDGKFKCVGDSVTVLATKLDGDEVTDLRGKLVCAGFNDSHMHVLMYGFALNSVMLASRTGSLSDMKKAICEFISEHNVAQGEWVKAIGWNQDYFTDVKRMPTKFDLDEVSKACPIIAYRCCEHCIVLNSLALVKLGIESENGLFFDSEMDVVFERMPAPSLDTIKMYIESASAALRSYGIFSCQSDDFSAFDNVHWSVVLKAFRELEEEGKLSVRVYEQCNFKTPADFKDFVSHGYHTGMGSDRFKIGPLKVLGDGSLGARTALLSAPYSDAPDKIGMGIYTQEELCEYITFANTHGFDVCVHAIGDACLDMVLNAYELAFREKPWTSPRHGIVHCQVTRKDQLDRIVALNLTVYAQTIFLDYDINIVFDRIGVERAEYSYSWKTLMKRGVLVSNGSDCPVELPDVMRGIKCAVTRESYSRPGFKYLPDEAFTLEEAIDSFTICGAIQSHEDDFKGLIKEGYVGEWWMVEG